VYDESLLPESLMRVKVMREPDKTGIKAAIKSGQDVQGARVVKRDRLVIE
jgi:Siphovirus Gp157